MSKPDWKDAPQRANYLSQDLDGTWYWFEIEPYPYARKLWANYDASWAAGSDNSINPEWESTLERRP